MTWRVVQLAVTCGLIVAAVFSPMSLECDQVLTIRIGNMLVAGCK